LKRGALIIALTAVDTSTDEVLVLKFKVLHGDVARGHTVRFQLLPIGLIAVLWYTVKDITPLPLDVPLCAVTLLERGEPPIV
jgi:hypothetical protein